MIKSVRGTRDLLPPDTALWNFVEAAARDVFRLYNFREIRTPIFEQTELFARSVGEETDIVSKEMYTWEDGIEPAELDLLPAWIAKHRDELKGFEIEISPEGKIGPIRPDLSLRSGSTLISLETKSRASLETVRQLARYGAELEASGSRDVRLYLLVPTGRATESVYRASREANVIIEELDVEIPQSLTLRPEATAGIVRAYIEHDLNRTGLLQRLYLIGPMFRRERPQKGRYRQFFQIDAEVIGPPTAGSESPSVDAELLEMLAKFLERIGITGWTLELNSVGCANDRPKFNEALRAALAKDIDKMCEDCRRRAVTNPLRVLDCKVPEDQPIIEKLPRMLDYLDESCRQHFQAVQDLLAAVSVPYVINARLVRGLDYYTRTAFEFTHGALGAQNAILGGGRYDGLSESLGGPKAPGIGFAIGEDRLVLALSKTAEEVSAPPDAYLAPLGAGMNREAAKLARELRRQGIAVELGDDNFRLKKSLETASKIGARYAIIVGENEVKADAFALKNLATGEQVTVPRAELAHRIQESRP